MSPLAAHALMSFITFFFPAVQKRERVTIEDKKTNKETGNRTTSGDNQLVNQVRPFTITPISPEIVEGFFHLSENFIVGILAKNRPDLKILLRKS